MSAGAAKLSEKAFTKMVIDCARLYGWRSAHFRPGMTKRGRWVTPVQGQGKGFPDLVLVHPSRRLVLFVELKTNNGVVQLDQRAWLEDLGRAGAGAAVWRPRDWPAIERALRGD